MLMKLRFFPFTKLKLLYVYTEYSTAIVCVLPFDLFSDRRLFLDVRF